MVYHDKTVEYTHIYSKNDNSLALFTYIFYINPIALFHIYMI